MTAADPKSLRQGHVSKALWNFLAQLMPVMTLSLRSRVTLSTFSMLDTKYSSGKKVVGCNTLV